MPNASDRLLDAGIDLILVRDIHGDADRRLSCRRARVRLPPRLEFKIGDDDAAARLHVALGDGMADAAGGAGDESDLAVELHGPHSSFL